MGDVGGESSFFLFNKGDLSTRVPIPWELRTGVEYKINEQTTLSVDAAIAGPTRNQRVFEPPAELADYKPDVVIAMNPIYVDEIRADLHAMGLDPELHAV